MHKALEALVYAVLLLISFILLSAGTIFAEIPEIRRIKVYLIPPSPIGRGRLGG